MPKLKGKNRAQASSRGDWRNVAAICLGLCLITAVLYAPVRHYKFVNYDDAEYVSDNAHVLGGLNGADVAWAFTTFHSSNWHPLTWISHMLDVDLWGANPGGHHITNVVLHTANAVLLFLVLLNMTAGPGGTSTIWRCAFVAAVFAWHPLHVESVAWISERKDVLSAFFWILTVAAYVRYARRSNVRTYLLVLALLACALMSKPMAVTLPFALLLLDYWPLGRIQRSEVGGERIQTLSRLAAEKVPMLVLVIISSALTIVAQHRGGAMKSVLEVPWPLRLSNAAVTYISYLVKTVWPVKLAVFYPFPPAIPLWETAGAAALLIAITMLVFAGAKRRPYLTTGWLWYVGTLLPVIGLVQVGDQSMADRYTYIPLIGISIAVAWGAQDFLCNTERAKFLTLGLAGAIALLLLQASARQLSYWRDSFTLFERALSVTRNNWLAQNNLSSAFLDELGDPEGAKTHAMEALRIRPNYAQGRMNLGAALLREGKTAEAIRQFEEAVALRPDFAEAHYDLASGLMRSGKVDEAVSHLNDALRIDPNHIGSLRGLAWIRATSPSAARRNGDEAVRLTERAASLTKYEDGEVLDVLAAAYAETGRFDDAVKTAQLARTSESATRDKAFTAEIDARLNLYRRRMPFREIPGDQ